MGLIREPKEVDFIIESQPWTSEELAEFRILMKDLKGDKKAKLPKTALKGTTKSYRTGSPV